jgi:hypothetical protein
MPIDEIVDVVAMWYGFMTATRTMHMAWFVSSAHMIRCTICGIYVAYSDGVLVHMVAMQVM